MVTYIMEFKFVFLSKANESYFLNESETIQNLGKSSK